MNPDTVSTLKSLGLNLIPVDGKTKIPKVEWKEYQTKRYDGPLDGDLGVVCGATSGNLLVIDLDDHSMMADFEKFNTFTVKTARGYHLYFRVEKEVPKGGAQRDDMHLDIQCGGSYVVAPGSIHRSGHVYAVQRDAPILQTTTAEISAHLKSKGYYPMRKKSKINAVRKGSRNNTMFAFACDRIESGLSGDALDYIMDDLNTKFEPPLEKSEVREIARKAERRTMTRRAPAPYDDSPGDTVPLSRVTTAYEGRYVRFACRVIAAGKHLTYVARAEFFCNKCRNTMAVNADDHLHIEPPWCADCSRRMGIIPENRQTNDAQYVVLQELISDADGHPAERNGLLLGDMAGTLNPGDSVVLGGIFRSFPSKGDFVEPTIILEDARPHGAHDPDPPTDSEVESWRNDPALFSRMRAEIAPHLLIPDEWRETVMLSMAGSPGPGRTMIHSMFIGDAQTGKSELLKSVLELYTGATGVDTNASSPGLLVAMRKMSDGTMIPTAGLIPMRDGGLVGLDEIDKLDSRVRNDLLAPMESGRAAMSKAGYPEVHMAARTTIIATGNPKNGRVDRNAPHIYDNFEFNDAFLSRFDIVWLVMDDPSKAMAKAEHASLHPERPPSDEARRYFRHVRTISVTVPPAVHAAAQQLYMELVRHSGDYPIGQRHYQGILRMAGASARLNLRPECTIQDVALVRRIMLSSLATLVKDGRSLATSAKLQVQGRDWELWTASGGDRKKFIEIAVLGGMGKTEAAEKYEEIAAK